MSGIKSEIVAVGYRKAYGMDEECPVGVKSERENKGGNTQGFRWKQWNASEPFSMSACSRHQEGGARGEQDQSKCPRIGMSLRVVSFNNPSLSPVWR